MATPPAAPHRQPKGYHKLAKLMGPNAEVAVFRRFGFLNMFNLLFMQAELMELERKFNGACLDDAASDIAAVKECCSSFVEMKKSEQKEVKDRLQTFEDIKQKLQEYNTALVLAADVANLQNPESNDLDLLKQWVLTEGDNFLISTEARAWHKENKGDLVVLSAPPSDTTPLLPSLSSLPLDICHRCFSRSRAKVPDIKTGVLKYYDLPFRRFNKLIVTIIASILPIAAIIVLYAVKGTWRRIYVTIGFTALFGLTMACSNARKAEIFASTAAFAAVEVVFIGSVSGS